MELLASCLQGSLLLDGLRLPWMRVGRVRVQATTHMCSHDMRRAATGDVLMSHTLLLRSSGFHGIRRSNDGCDAMLLGDPVPGNGAPPTKCAHSGHQSLHRDCMSAPVSERTTYAFMQTLDEVQMISPDANFLPFPLQANVVTYNTFPHLPVMELNIENTIDRHILLFVCVPATREHYNPPMVCLRQPWNRNQEF